MTNDKTTWGGVKHFLISLKQRALCPPQGEQSVQLFTSITLSFGHGLCWYISSQWKEKLGFSKAKYYTIWNSGPKAMFSVKGKTLKIVPQNFKILTMKLLIMIIDVPTIINSLRIKIQMFSETIWPSDINLWDKT